MWYAKSPERDQAPNGLGVFDPLSLLVVAPTVVGGLLSLWSGDKAKEDAKKKQAQQLAVQKEQSFMQARTQAEQQALAAQMAQVEAVEKQNKTTLVTIAAVGGIALVIGGVFFLAGIVRRDRN